MAITVFVLAIAVGLVALLFVYEKEVKSAIVAELNRHLKAEVRINPNDIDITVLKSFPDCSIEFRRVLMLEALPIKKRDTLAYVDALNLHFNVMDLWNSNYTIRKIKLCDGVLKLSVTRSGKANYIFWDNTSPSSGDSLRFSLSLISMQNFRMTYQNRQSGLKANLQVAKLSLRGNFDRSDYELVSSANLKVNMLSMDNRIILKEKDVDFHTELDVHGESYTLKRTSLEVNRLGVALSGSFKYGDSLSAVSLKFNAPRLDIGALLSLLPEAYSGRMNDYVSSGNFYASGHLKYDHGKKFALVSEFGVKSGKITYRPNGTVVDGVGLDGTLRYSDKESVLDLRGFSMKMDDDEASGDLRIENFEDPNLEMNARAHLNLANLQKFWPVDTISSLSGKLAFNSHIKGFLRDIKKNAFSSDVDLNVDAVVSQLEARFKNDSRTYAVENVSITAREREVEVKNLRLKRGQSDITLNGKIPGLFNYLIDRASVLVINGRLSSGHLCLDDFIPERSGPESDSPLIPGNLKFSLDASISQFTFGKFTAENITGDIEILNQKAIASDVKFETMEGSATVNAYADNSGKKLDLVFQGDLKGINISQLFTEMNNFGQSTLQDKNIKGYASAQVDFSGSWSNKLVSDPSSIRATCKLNITGGELNDFKPLLSLAKYIEVKELQRIKFSTLQSDLKIENSLITIPRTSIRNSALNIDVWGTHSFNNDLNYHFSLLISELIAKKRKKADDEFGPVANDPENRRKAFILMTGTVDNPVIRYDKQGMKEKVREDIRQERQNIKAILKEEFGLFKKDSLKRAARTEPAFELEKPQQPQKKTLELKKKDDEDF